jgi:hypothetical protein
LRSIRGQEFSGFKSLPHFRIVGSVEEIAAEVVQGSVVHDVAVDEDTNDFKAIDGFLVRREEKVIACYW